MLKRIQIVNRIKSKNIWSLDFLFEFSNCKNIVHISKKLASYNSQDNFLINKKNNVEKLSANKYVKRSHTCGELTIDNIGQIVNLFGWMEYQRMGRFITLRDSYGSTQLVIPDDNQSLIKIVEKLNYESTISVNGKVIARPPGQENKKMQTGAIEVQVNTLEILNESVSQLPFYIREHNVPKESLQMQYRYLALRFPSMQKNLRIRSFMIHCMREYLIEHCGFVDVETPTLFRRTPGGAQEFVVPTQYAGKFYSLVQSPQQFKQLLMVGGIDKYFQIARCYRDESARPDRQPEFTQLDIEIAFTDREEIMSLIEDLLVYCWPRELCELKIPFKRIPYELCMETYGTDQPDLRIPYRIWNVTDFISNNNFESKEFAIYALCVPDGSKFLTGSAKKQLNDIKEKYFKQIKLIQTKIMDDSWHTKLDKLGLNFDGLTQLININKGDALFLTIGEKDDARKLLGKIRVEFTDVVESKNNQVKFRKYEFVWIYDFPLFEKDEGKLVSSHHPFTAPHPEDMKYLENDPLRTRGLHYDLVLNGWEIAGGSIRIHNAEYQKMILKMLDIDSSQMKHLLDALASGAPPHGGIAFGLDRLIAIICNAPTIRSVIAFPKSAEGRDLMSGAPADISEAEKKLYHLKLLENNDSDVKIN